jgi:AcrR family transcriptional regulator/transposase-like protein
MIDPQIAIFTDPKRARAALEAIRWPDGPVCPHCGSAEKIGSVNGKSHRDGLYRCGNCACQFTVTVQTVFEGSKIPLNKWWLATHLLGSSKEGGVSINQLHRKLGVTYKTAWFMAHRLRDALKSRHLDSIGDLTGNAGASDADPFKSSQTGRSKFSAPQTRMVKIMSALVAHDGRNVMPQKRLEKTIRSRDEKKKRNPNSTRTAILEVACSQLAKRGVEGLSLTEVAHIAGVNRGTAYHHFKTREKLVKATTDWVSEMLYRAVYGEPGQERPVEKFDVPNLNDRLAYFALKNPELCRVWLLQVLSSPDPSNDLFWREYLGSNVRWAKSKFAQPNIDYEVATVITLAGHFLWPVWVQAHFKGRRVEQKLARRFTNELLRLSMFGSLQPDKYPDIIKRLRAET